MPNSLDTVIMQEHCQREAETIHIDARHKAGQNVRIAGEDISQGATILAAGKKLTPPDISVRPS
jgi:molybdopterin molybdotransferase